MIPLPTPKVMLLREAIRSGLVESEIWQDGEIIVSRQGEDDFWNEVATVMSAARHECVLAIAVAAGDSDDAHGLFCDVTVALTILARRIIAPDQWPEEILWEKTVQLLQGSVPEYPGSIVHVDYKMRFQGFRDAPELVEGNEDVFQLARQTVFKVRMSLEPAPSN